jgi:hypothetical protein
MRLSVVTHSDGDGGGLLYDGKTITQFNIAENVYSTTNQPGHVDTAVRYAVGKMGMRVPLAHTLLTTLPQEMAKLQMEIAAVKKTRLRPPRLIISPIPLLKRRFLLVLPTQRIKSG